ARVTVLGAGTMGSGIAQTCAAAGSGVCLFDIGQELIDRGRERIEAFLARGVEKGKIAAAEQLATLGRITTSTDLDAACADADLVIEAVPEDVELKRGLFGR